MNVRKIASFKPLMMLVLLSIPLATSCDDDVSSISETELCKKACSQSERCETEHFYYDFDNINECVGDCLHKDPLEQCIDKAIGEECKKLKTYLDKCVAVLNCDDYYEWREETTSNYPCKYEEEKFQAQCEDKYYKAHDTCYETPSHNEEELAEGYWEETQITDNINDISGVSLSDVDQDGDQDVIATGKTSSSIEWFENEKDGAQWTQHSIDDSFPSPGLMVVFDFDGNGSDDVLVFEKNIYRAGAATFFMNDGNGSSWTKQVMEEDLFHIALDTGQMIRDFGPSPLAAADMDDDGDGDLVLPSGDGVIWLENVDGGATSWSVRVVDEYFEPNFVVAGDIDGDGLKDIVASSDSNSTVAWWGNAGEKEMTNDVLITGNLREPSSIIIEDLDGDNDADIAVEMFLEGAVWFENVNGDGSAWEEHVLGDRPNSVSPSDFVDINKDGNIDILGTWAFNGPSWWYKDDSGSEYGWGKEEISDHNGISLPRAADLDGDGWTDVICSLSEEDEIFWLKNPGF